MMMCISYASGILFVENLVLLAGLTATTMTFGYITELLNRPNGQIWIERNLTPHILGYVPMTIVWAIVFSVFHRSSVPVQC